MRGVALLLPDGTAIGGRSAAAWHGAPFAGVQDPVTVLRPPEVLCKGPRGTRVHRTPLTSAEVEERDAVPVTTALRTAWDVAALESVLTAVALLDGMVRAGHLALEDLRRRLEDSRGRWRSTRVAKVLPLVDGRSESPPESWVRVACALARLPAPVPQFDVVADGVWLGRVDRAWPEQKLIVEYEGAYHFDGLQIAKDDARFERLVAAGWRVIRLSAHDLRDLDGVVRRIADALLFD